MVSLAIPQNAGRTLDALSKFGFGHSGIRTADLCTPGMVIQLGVAPNRIDLLTAISGVAFEEAWATCSEAELEGIPVRYVGRAALLRNKEQTGRAKDLGDAEELRRRTTEHEG
jgi:hypothetical protein